jgi:hypothetical protein
MAEPVTVAMLLRAFAVAAGQAFGREMAKQFANLMFGTLATKEDLQKAVDEIKRFIDQVMDEHEERDGIVVPILDSIRSLEDWYKYGTPQTLETARTQSTHAINWFKTRQAIDDTTYRRLFVYLAKVVSNDLAIQTELVLNVKDRQKRRDAHKALADMLKEHADLIEVGISSMEKFEHTTVSPIQVEREKHRFLIEIVMRGPDNPFPERPLPLRYQAVWWLSSPKYGPSGRSVRSADYGDTAEEAMAFGIPKHKKDVDLVASEAEARQTIYDAARDFTNALKGMQANVLAFEPEE